MKKTVLFILTLFMAITVIARTVNPKFLTYTTAAASAYSSLPSVNCTLVKVQNTTASDITFVRTAELGTSATNLFVLKASATYPFTVVADSSELSASAGAQVSPQIEVVTENP